MANYATAAQVGYFAQEFNALDTGGATLIIASASRLFDKLAEVSDDFFAAADSSFTDRDFIGDGTAYLKIDPHTELNSSDPVLINNGTINDPDFVATDIPEYVVRDSTLVVLDKTNQNFNRVTPEYDRFTGWPDGVQIRVSAKWGFDAIPSDITLAVAQIAIQQWRTADPAFTAISQSEGALPAIPLQAEEIAKKYREIYSRRMIFA